MLDPGSDDVSGPLDLRYDAVISVNGGPALALGRSLVPSARADGATVLRIDTKGLGRVLGKPFTLTLTAVDAAGNAADASINHTVDAADGGGCASTSGDAPAVAFAALLALVPLRRRRRAR